MVKSVRRKTNQDSISEENKVFKIDNKDKEILRLLNENARMTSKALGASTNISREVADYRIKRLIKTGLISGFITIVNDSKLGYETHLLLLKLHNYTTEDEIRILEFLSKHPFVKWVLKSSGDWDIQTAIAARNKKHLATMIDEIDGFCGNRLLKYDLLTTINLLVPENLSFLLQSSTRQITPKDLPVIEKEDNKIVDVDAKDKFLLKALAVDARASIVTVAREIKLSADATNIRMKKLKKSGVIKKYQTVVDLSTLNYLLYSVFIKISNYSEKRESQIRTFLYSLSPITFAERIIGLWDIRLQISCATPQEFELILQKIREFLGPDIKYYNFALMIKEYKRVSYPEGITDAKSSNTI